MDQMLPSPGFSIPSIGTPLHQPEEDQMILPHAQQQQQHNQQSSSVMGGSMSGTQPPQPMMTPHKMHTYAPSVAGFQTPHSMMQPQTPVSFIIHSFS